MAEPVTVKGESKQTIWRAEVIDEYKVPREWLIVNQKALDKFASATKGATRVPGVIFKEDTILKIRR